MSILKEAKERFGRREIGHEVSAADKAWLIENNLVVIYGASDDLAEIDGAVCDEVGIGWRNKSILFHRGSVYVPECDDEGCPHEEAIRNNCERVGVRWDESITGPSWYYIATFPHETFDVYDGDDYYCQAVIFKAESIR